MQVQTVVQPTRYFRAGHL